MTDYYFGADASDEEIDELMAWDNQVAEEDVSLVQSVQRGLESGAVPQGRLMGRASSSSPTSSAACAHDAACVGVGGERSASRPSCAQVVDEAAARFFERVADPAGPG